MNNKKSAQIHKYHEPITICFTHNNENILDMIIRLYITVKVLKRNGTPTKLQSTDELSSIVEGNQYSNCECNAFVYFPNSIDMVCDR